MSSPRLLAWSLALAAFLAMAPTLPMLDFSGGSENLVVATALESYRTGRWLRPTLNGRPRVAKPPLAMWVSALAMSDRTLDQLESDSAWRKAYRMLAWQARWPALAAMCILLVVVFEIASTVADTRCALVALCIAGSTLLFHRFARGATTDVYLSLGVAVSCWGTCLALVRGRWYAGMLLAGGGLGIALLSKGPVALAQTAMPAAALAGWMGWNREILASRRRIAVACATGAALALAIAMPWPFAAYRDDPRVLDLWWTEITRMGATDLDPDPWYTYVSLILYLLPWIALAAAMATWRRWRRSPEPAPSVPGLQNETDGAAAVSSRGPILIGLLFLLIPLIIMSLVKDKSERYLLPLLCPAALALAGIVAPPGQEGRGQVRLGIAALFMALAVQIPAMWLYAGTDNGRSRLLPLAAVIREEARDAEVYYYDPRPRPRHVPMDLAIYLNREVRTATSFAHIPKGGRRVAVSLLRDGEAILSLGTEWRLIASECRGRRTWNAWIRE